MGASFKRTVVGSLAALAIGIATVGASAAPPLLPKGGAPHVAHNGGNWHGGGGGNGHWHGGGGGGGGWGPAAVGLGILGLAAGAAAASQAGPGPYDDGCTGYRPVYDAYGNYMGQRPVNIC
jgi:hypothetical protein